MQRFLFFTLFQILLPAWIAGPTRPLSSFALRNDRGVWMD